MISRTRRAIVAVVAVLAGSVATYFLIFIILEDFGYDSARSSLCETIDSNGWTGGVSVASGFTRNVNGVRYYFRVNSETHGSRDADVFLERAPIPNVYWLSVSGGTDGSAVGMRAPPMTYNPANAAIEIGGKNVRALQRGWVKFEAQDEHGVSQLSLREISIPVTLNKLQSESTGDFVPVYLAFSIKTPNVGESYVVRPGSILLDGENTELPSLRSCFVPGRWRAHPIH